MCKVRWEGSERNKERDEVEIFTLIRNYDYFKASLKKFSMNSSNRRKSSNPENIGDFIKIQRKDYSEAAEAYFNSFSSKKLLDFVTNMDLSTFSALIHRIIAT